MKTNTLCLVLSLAIGDMFAQTPTPGLWADQNGNPGNLQALTPGALGVGTAVPEAKTDIRYCLPLTGHYPGFVLTRVQCQPPVSGGGGVIPGGFDDVPGPEGSPGGAPQVAITPSHAYVSVTPLNFPLSGLPAAMEPLLWTRVQTPATATDPGKNDSRFIVYPDGRSGINVADPRCALDVRGFGINAPAAIFGVNALRPALAPAGLVPRRYTRHVEIIPHLGHQGYNSISQSADLGVLFTDGMGQEGSNLDGALVIAPWSSDNTAGGLRMEANGNTELRGNFRCTRVTVNAKWWPDAVFADDYRLMPLSEVAGFIKANRHLPGIPSEKAVLENGQDVGALQVLQQQKIEELTLYAIEQEQKSAAQQQLILEQKKKLEEQEARLRKLESILTQK
jgi:hypothetical protein